MSPRVFDMMTALTVFGRTTEFNDCRTASN